MHCLRYCTGNALILRAIREAQPTALCVIWPHTVGTALAAVRFGR